jgi:hypothetical protein
MSDNATGSDQGPLKAEQSAADQQSVLDLARLGKPGQRFSQDFMIPTAGLTFAADTARAIRHFQGVRAVAAALTIEVDHAEGTVPLVVATFVRPARVLRVLPPTQAEAATADACIARLAPEARTAEGIFKCLPERMRQVESQGQVLADQIGSPATDIRTSSLIIGGVDPSTLGIGLVTPRQLTRGRFLRCCGREALLDEVYADRSGLNVGQDVTILNQRFKIVGLVRAPLGEASAFVSLPTLQQVSGRVDQINRLLVQADTASSVDRIRSSISGRWRELRISTDANTATAVGVSLSTIATVLIRFENAIRAVAIAGGLTYVGLLTLAGARRRYRELAVLRALGWSRRRVAAQLASEASLIGFTAGASGIGVGWLAMLVVNPLLPPLVVEQLAHAGYVKAVRIVPVSDPTTWLGLLLLIAIATAGLGLVAGLNVAGRWPAVRLADRE